MAAALGIQQVEPMEDKDEVIRQQAGRIQVLEQELHIVHRLLEQFQGRQMDQIAGRRRAALAYYREEYERLHPNGPFTGGGGQDVIEYM